MPAAKSALALYVAPAMLARAESLLTDKDKESP